MSYLEDQVANLLLQPANLYTLAQEELLQDIPISYTDDDNSILKKMPYKKEVRESIWSTNADAAPGTDGLTTFFYKHYWDSFGDMLTEVMQPVHQENSTTSSQKTSLMVFGQEHLPVNYIVLSEHLDIVGVKHMNTHSKTRKTN